MAALSAQVSLGRSRASGFFDMLLWQGRFRPCHFYKCFLITGKGALQRLQRALVLPVQMRILVHFPSLKRMEANRYRDT